MKTKRGVYLILTIVELLAGSLSPARTLFVDDDAEPGGDGRRWESAYCFLQDALVNAATWATPVEIHIAQGRYRPDLGQGMILGDREATFYLLDGVTLMGGYAGLAALDPNARDIAAFRTVLTGDLNGDDGPDFSNRSDNSLVVITSISNDASAALAGLFVTGGNGPVGAGLTCHESAPVVSDCTFAANAALGGDWRSGLDAGDGGAVFNSSGRPGFERCRFEGNRAESDGGALWSRDGGGVTLVDCTFAGNTARERGGAIGCFVSDLSATGCALEDNHVASHGGALYIYKGAQYVNRCRFRYNSAAWGGAIYNIVGNLSVAQCLFTGNHAHYEGGGLYNDAPNPVCVASSLFAGNRALAMGGGLFNWCDSDPNVINCTFADNRAALGSAVAAGLPVLKNCIAWNQGTETPPVFPLGGGPTISYSCIQGGWVGEGNMMVDPCFAKAGAWLDVNETPDDPNDDVWTDGDYHLMSQTGRWDPNDDRWVCDAVDSPCIDAGDPDSPVACEPLPHGDRINMGAYGGTGEASKSHYGTAAYQFLPDQSTLFQSGGIAGVRWTYRIEGSFALTVDYENGTAEFVDVQAKATDIDVPERSIDIEAEFLLTSLTGTVQDDGAIIFVGIAADGSAVDLRCTVAGETVEMTGQTTPPPNTADFFLFTLNAVAQRLCSVEAEIGFR